MSSYSWGPQDLSAPKRVNLPEVAAETGLVVEEVQTGWVGAIVRVEKSGGMHLVVLEDRRGRTRSFSLGFGFLLDGAPVRLVPHPVKAAGQPGRTASGSVRVVHRRAQVARASRIWVEGKHDAELVEKVWGDDLRVEGIVVEPLHGIDDLPAAVRDFAPSSGRRLGILVDHLVPGSKESRIAADAMKVSGSAGNVLIVGHPYVDVWQAIKPVTVGLQEWPVVSRGEDWKTGILRGLGWPHATQQDVAAGWRNLLSRVQSYADLEASLLGRVEEVIDFLTAGP